MRWTAASLCVACAATALLLAHAAFGEQPSGDSPTPTEAAPPGHAGVAVDVSVESGGAAPNAMIDEIRRIRRRLNIDPLKGTSLESAPEATGNAVPEGSSTVYRKKTPQADDDAEFADTLRKFVPRVAVRPPTADRVFFESDTTSPAPSSEQQFLASLQTTARQLAMRAETLESRREYAAADRLRRLAAKIRRESRRLAP